MTRPVNLDDGRDVQWLRWLFEQQLSRDERRRDSEDKVFSPSSLSACLRQVYFFKNHEELGIQWSFLPRMEPNFFFLHGNFLHVKWQYVLYKMGKVLDPDDFELVVTEYPIMSKHGDHGGTIDNVVRVQGEPLIVDWKGLNVRTFGKITRNEIPTAYTMQTSDYAMLYNSSRKRPTEKVERVLLMSESKGGPDKMHPVALAESIITPNVKIVRQRLEVLRQHEQENSIPEPECVSTQSFQFTDCPFAGYCKKEILAIEKRRRRSDDSDSKKYRVAVPRGGRNNRSR